MRRVTAFAASLCSKAVILGKAPLAWVDTLPAFSPRSRGQALVLREAALLVGHALAPLARDGAAFLKVHRREAPTRGSRHALRCIRHRLTLAADCKALPHGNALLEPEFRRDTADAGSAPRRYAAALKAEGVPCQIQHACVLSTC